MNKTPNIVFGSPGQKYDFGVKPWHYLAYDDVSMFEEEPETKVEDIVLGIMFGLLFGEMIVAITYERPSLTQISAHIGVTAVLVYVINQLIEWRPAIDWIRKEYYTCFGKFTE